MTRFALALSLLSMSFAACGEKKEEAPAAKPSEPAAKTTTEPTAPVSEEPVMDERAAKADALQKAIELSPAFTENFLAALEADDETKWLELFTAERRARIEADGAARKSLDAWRRGTMTKAVQIRAAEHMIAINPAGGFFLAYKDVMVANDPENIFKFAVVVEDGQMLLNEL